MGLKPSSTLGFTLGSHASKPMFPQIPTSQKHPFPHTFLALDISLGFSFHL